MTAAKVKEPGELRMGADEFDRIMKRALQVRPEPKAEKATKIAAPKKHTPKPKA